MRVNLVNSICKINRLCLRDVLILQSLKNQIKFCKRFNSSCSNQIFLNVLRQEPTDKRLSFKKSDSSKMSESNQNGVGFKGRVDVFNGVIINSDKETCSLEEFERKLDESLTIWRANNHRGIWFNVHLDQAGWVPILAKKGFKYHHANDDVVTMILWLPIKEPSSIPPYAHTMIGVGAIVINDKSQVLVVSDKHTTFKNIKLPGGYVEPGENLVDAAIREVYEETRIKTEFKTLVSFRHAHQGMFKCSDIYFVVALKPLNNDIQMCEKELTMSKWMDLNDYFKDPLVHHLNRFVVQKYLEFVKSNTKFDCHHGIHEKLKKPFTMYYVLNSDNNGTLV